MVGALAFGAVPEEGCRAALAGSGVGEMLQSGKAGMSKPLQDRSEGVF